MWWCGWVLFFEQQKLMASDAAMGDSYGWAVTILDDTIVGTGMGAYGGSNTGAAYVVVRVGPSWSEQQKGCPATLPMT